MNLLRNREMCFFNQVFLFGDNPPRGTVGKDAVVLTRIGCREVPC